MTMATDVTGNGIATANGAADASSAIAPAT
jgi:hypothetical protein